jgi:hypothetical protein
MERGHSSCTERIAVPAQIEPHYDFTTGRTFARRIVSSLLMRQVPVT